MERASNQAGLVASDLWLARGGREALGGVSVAVPRGEITALIAPSGAGKTTLLRCLTRLADPDRGTVTLDGTAVRELDPRALRRRVGLVAQAPVMLPGSIAANVGYGLAADVQGEALERCVARAMESAGLPPAWADRPADGLSGGECARVAVARALALGPEVLLLDEPTSALDAATAGLLGATLAQLADRGIGILFATHDLAFAKRFSTRTVQLARPPAPGA